MTDNVKPPDGYVSPYWREILSDGEVRVHQKQPKDFIPIWLSTEPPISSEMIRAAESAVVSYFSSRTDEHLEAIVTLSKLLPTEKV